MARKTVSEQDRALAFIKTATREQLDSFIQTATLVRDVKWPAVAAGTIKIRAVKASINKAMEAGGQAAIASGTAYGEQ